MQEAKGLNTEIRDELLSLPITDAPSELAGLMDAIEPLVAGDEVIISSPRTFMMRRMLKLIRYLYGRGLDARPCDDRCAAMIAVSRRGQGKAALRMPIHQYDDMRSRIALSSNDWIWFRGVWGICGSICLPQNGYYMYMRIRDKDDMISRLSDTMASSGVRPRTRKTGAGWEVTVRDQEDIVACLLGMGAVRSSLMLEETTIIRSLKSRANKQVNCDAANINKTLTAAREQLAVVDTIDEAGAWDRLPSHMAELAMARRANPSASLRELGQILSTPVSKSTVEYRWKKLGAFVDILKKGDGHDVPGKG